jgi:diadenosine tetraphosphate (Ap4A) HIT family hydrolase
MPKLTVQGITDEGTLACLTRSRKFGQYKKAVEDALAGRCPFCQVDRNYNKIIFENDLGYAWHCKPPEANTKLHFLVVPKRHVTDSTDLSDEELLCLMKKIPSYLQNVFGFQSRGVLLRDGDATLSAGTIQHLHVHIMVPDGTGRVESPFYKGADAENEGIARAIIFEKLRTGTNPNDLSESEKKLVEGRL